MALRDGAGRQRDARLVGADQRRDLLFGDQAQRLILTGGRRALVVGEDELDLGAAEARQATALGQRDDLGEIGVAVVDDVGADFHRHLRVVAGTRRVSAQRVDDADLDRRLLGGCPCRQPENGRSGPCRESPTRCLAHKHTPFLAFPSPKSGTSRAGQQTR